MKKHSTIFALMVLLAPVFLAATTLHVGPLQQYADPKSAILQAKPGDTVLLHASQYKGAFWIENVFGTATAPIVIRGENRETVVFEAGGESFHFADCSHLVVENFTVKGQTSNGMNCDDGGTFETPAHHVTFRNLHFAALSATGNNDQLKLSGLDSFVVENCVFENGSAGGSGIDMVGCHYGVFRNNTFTKEGSNCIQAKGGCRFLRIERNTFVDGGERSINLGGSTGLQFFRPIDAPFEAADIDVVANLFVRATTPLAYVGCVRVSVTNNTIIDPVRWVFRILQETVDASRFLPCGDNVFQNNLVVFRSSLSTHVNIGPNTAPSTFVLRNNLWYNVDAPAASQPQVKDWTETGSLYGRDPLLRGYTSGDYRLRTGSPAIGAGIANTGAIADLDNKLYVVPPSIGAYEGSDVTSVHEQSGASGVRLTRTIGGWWLEAPQEHLPQTVYVYDINGALSKSVELHEPRTFIPTSVWEFVSPL